MAGIYSLGIDPPTRRVLERITGARFLRNEVNLTVTVLTFTARLPLVHTLCVHLVSERFSVSDLRRADVGFHLEFSQKSVHDDVEVKFAHARDDRLSRFLIGIRLERGIFFGELDERHGHLFLTRFGLRLQRELNDGLGEDHFFENDGMFFVAERVARRRVFKSDDGADVARVDLGNILSLIGVHLHEAPYSLLLFLRGVIHVGAGGKYARISAEIGEGSHEPGPWRS